MPSRERNLHDDVILMTTTTILTNTIIMKHVEMSTINSAFQIKLEKTRFIELVVSDEKRKEEAVVVAFGPRKVEIHPPLMIMAMMMNITAIIDIITIIAIVTMK